MSTAIVKKPASIKKLITDETKKKLIQAAITEIPNFQSLKMNDDLILYIIQLVEEILGTKNRQKIVEIITSTISHTQDEILILHSRIDELYNANRVQKVSTFRRVKYFVLSNFFLPAKSS